jgi:glycerate dehydrogenase
MPGAEPMRAVFLDFETIRPVDLDATPLERLLPGMQVYADTPEELIVERMHAAEIVLINKVNLTRDRLLAAPALKLVCLAATGVDNVDVTAARERGIGVANIRNYCAPSVVQHVFALLLGLNQRLREYDALLAAGAWEDSRGFCLLDFPFRELRGLTLGIVGLGNLGGGVARVAQAFGMRVVAARRPFVLDAAPAPATMSGTDGIERVTFTELVETADVVSLHCPLNAETRGLFGAATIGRMRRGAFLINTARGALVEPEALLEALRSGHLGGAGIDVLEHEPPVAGHPFLDVSLPNLVVTPHMAWAARESRQRALDEMALNVQDFLAGGRRNRVD